MGGWFREGGDALQRPPGCTSRRCPARLSHVQALGRSRYGAVCQTSSSICRSRCSSRAVAAAGAGTRGECHPTVPPTSSTRRLDVPNSPNSRDVPTPCPLRVPLPRKGAQALSPIAPRGSPRYLQSGDDACCPQQDYLCVIKFQEAQPGRSVAAQWPLLQFQCRKGGSTFDSS